MSEPKQRKLRLQFNLATLLFLLLLAAAQFAWMAIMYRKLEQTRIQLERERARVEQLHLLASQAAEQALRLMQDNPLPTDSERTELLESMRQFEADTVDRMLPTTMASEKTNSD